MKRGKMVYVPKNVLDETEKIMQENSIKRRAEAFDKMVKYAQVGKEAENIYRLDFRKLLRRK